MRAAVLRNTGDEKLDVVDTIETGVVGPTDVRVRIHATGVCHSDIHGMEGSLPQQTPAVLGHEGAGEVVEIGTSVTGLAVGDHVVIAWSPPCGRCVACVDQKSPHLCVMIQFAAMGTARFTEAGTPVFGFSGTGTFAEEIIVAQEAAIAIDADVPYEIASLIGCGVTTGVGAVINTAKVEPGSTAVVFGCGGVGMSVVQGLRIAGAAVIVAVDLNDGKLEQAKQFGATHAVKPDDLDALKGEVTGAAGGFDYAFEAIGLPVTVRASYDAVRRGGTAVVVGAGSPKATVEFNLLELFFQEKTLKGSYYGSADVRSDFHRLLRLWRAGKLDLEGMITKRLKLDEINDAINALKKGEAIRSVITI
jgi:S-(hydroxymethyl)glutathione dehydrogenase / alcohol dehydrogenase